MKILLYVLVALSFLILLRLIIKVLIKLLTLVQDKLEARTGDYRLDVQGVKYSRDGKTLLEATKPIEGKYLVEAGTEYIQEDAFLAAGEGLECIILPANEITLATMPWGKSLLIAEGYLVGVEDYVLTSGERLPKVYIDSRAVYSGDKTVLLQLHNKENAQPYTIPEGVKKIAPYAFREAKLQKLVLPQSLEEIGRGAFQVSDIERIVIPPKVRVIPEHAFSESCLRGIILPEGLERIEEGAFSRTDIEYIQLPKSLRHIGQEAFYESSLRTITIPEGMESLGYAALEYCHALEEVHLPKTLRRIEYWALRDCHELRHLTLPEGLEHIEGKAFWYTYFDSVTSLSPHFVVDGPCIYNSDRTQLIYVYRRDVESLELAPTLERIECGAIDCLFKLKELVLPPSLLVIDEDAISRCPLVREIRLPEGLVELGRLNFSGFEALRDVYLPQGLIDSLCAEEDRDLAFGSHVLEHIYVPAGCEEACRSLLREGRRHLLTSIPPLG